MKINNKNYSEIIKWSITIVLAAICLNYSVLAYGSFSAIKAHEQSERTYHYGPSKIIKTIDLDGGKIYLCRYKDWFSANTVKKGIFKWYPGDQVSGTPIDYSKQVSYSYSTSNIKDNITYMKIYGYVNDPKITAMFLEYDNNTSSPRYVLNEDREFIFYWNVANQKSKIKYLIGTDKDGKVIYQQEIIGL